MEAFTQSTGVETVDQRHAAAAADHRHDRDRTHVVTGPQGAPLVLGIIPLEHRHAARGRAGHAVEHGHVVAGPGQYRFFHGRDVVHHERVAVIHRHRLFRLHGRHVRAHVDDTLVGHPRRRSAGLLLPAGRDLVAPHGDDVHLFRAVGEHHQFVFLRTVAHQGRRGAGAVGNLDRREAWPALVRGLPGTAGFVGVDLALLVDHQAVHVLVGRDIHRAAIDFRAGGEGVEEQFVAAFDAVAVDQFQRGAVEGGHGSAHGVDHQEAVGGHAHAKGGVHRHANTVFGLFIVEQFIRKLHFPGELHAGARVLVIVLVDAEHPASAGTNEGIVAGQQGIDSAAQQLVSGAGQHAVRLRTHVIEQTFLVLGLEKLAGLRGLLQTLFRGDRLVIGQFDRQVDAGHFGELEVVRDLHLAQRKTGPEPVQVGIANLVAVLHQAARLIGQYTVGVRGHFVSTTRHGDVGAVRGPIVPMGLVVVGLRQIRVGRCDLGQGQRRNRQQSRQQCPMGT
ncbi:hypothetical protein D3C76_794360 [compost metagenome]